VNKIQTLGELRASGWCYRSVKHELMENMITRMTAGEPLFPRILGYDDTVIPELENAVLSGHDILILGERGQAKSRLIRTLVQLLDEWMPAVSGCEILDNPFAPICHECRVRAVEMGDRLPIVWIPREDRFGEKLATPDVSVSDLIGDVDPIKVAEGRYLSDERVIHFGILPRTNRGIFAINELPDLSEKVQVSLFNILEEGDVQIKGFKVRLPLDMLIVATANPEDYTHRGRIITPLKDRYASQVRTHYPIKREIEMAIVEQEVQLNIGSERRSIFPGYVKEIITGLTFEARQCPEINQSSGVSVRMSIANYESVLASAYKRAIRLGETEVVPRISDLPAVFASSRGKIEIEYAGEDQTEVEIVDRLLRRSIRGIFDQYFRVEDLEPVIRIFDAGAVVEVSADSPSAQYKDFIKQVPSLREALKVLGLSDSPAQLASAAEFVLEGLHLNQKLNKELRKDKTVYRISPQAPKPKPTIKRERGEGFH
jgi:magnesium chelatase subunit I